MEQQIENIVVASVIDTDRIVINYGEENGIKEYMRFLVYELKDEIFDPISNKSLGILESPKGTFKVFHLQEKMTVLISELSKPNRNLGISTILGDVKPERDILGTIRRGDKVKIINKI
jgi:hypothetical protein